MYLRDDTDEEIEADAIAGLEPWRERFGADARDVRLVGIVVGDIVHVVRQLSVDADWLHPLKHAVF